MTFSTQNNGHHPKKSRENRLYPWKKPQFWGLRSSERQKTQICSPEAKFLPINPFKNSLNQISRLKKRRKTLRFRKFIKITWNYKELALVIFSWFKILATQIRRNRGKFVDIHRISHQKTLFLTTEHPTLKKEPLNYQTHQPKENTPTPQDHQFSNQDQASAVKSR